MVKIKIIIIIIADVKLLYTLDTHIHPQNNRGRVVDLHNKNFKLYFYCESAGKYPILYIYCWHLIYYVNFLIILF